MGVALPTLDVLLHEVNDRHVAAMQGIPTSALAQSLERIRKIRDRHWLKYKSSNARAALTKLREDEVWSGVAGDALLGRWWIGAFGYRQADTSHQDFYGRLPNDSESLLPTQWDERRLDAELATMFRRGIKDVVIGAIAESMRTGKIVSAVAAEHYIQAFVRAPERDEAYLVLGSGGIYNEQIIAVILDSVPGVPHDDWQPEPTENLGIEPHSGEVLWSTMLPPEAQARIVQIADELNAEEEPPQQPHRDC